MSACALSSQSFFTMKHTTSSKEIVLDFWRRAIGQRDLLFAEKIISDQYIQHSAVVKDGKSGILESLEALSKMPKRPSDTKPLTRVIADRDMVAVHMLLEMGNQKLVLLDLMRVQDGLLIEHWDALQPVPDDTGNFIIEGLSIPINHDDSDENQRIITRYVREVLLKHEENAGYFADNFIEHDPYNCLQKCSFECVHRIIGEGDLVLIQATGTIASKPYVSYDIFRVSAGKIAEHWNVHQLIPEKMPHGNKMI